MYVQLLARLVKLIFLDFNIFCIGQKVHSENYNINYLEASSQ